MRCAFIALALASLACGAPAGAGDLYRCKVDTSAGVVYTNKRPVDRECTMISTRWEVGDTTDKGLVVEVKAPIVKVQTPTGERWVKAEELRPAKAK